MLMKEIESEKFLCQEMSRHPLDRFTVVHCKGSYCAAWRWFDARGVKDEKRRGYCGKVGKPLEEFY